MTEPNAASKLGKDKKPTQKRVMFSKTTQEILNGVTLHLSASYGTYQYPIKKNILFIGDDTVIYLSGRHLVEYDIIRRKQAFITKNIDDDTVTAMNYYKTRKNILKIAVALKSTNQTLPLVKVYNTTKNSAYNLVHSHLDPKTLINDLVFGIKSKYLLTAAEVERNQKYLLSIWLVDKERLCGTIVVDTEITKLDLCPRQQNQFSISGRNYLKIWEYDVVAKVFEENKNVKKSLEIIQNEYIIDHSWLKNSNIIIAITKSMTIYAFNNFELIDKYQYVLNIQDEISLIEEQKRGFLSETRNDNSSNKKLTIDSNYSLASLSPTANGFTIGLQNAGYISVFELDKNHKIKLLGNFGTKVNNFYKFHSISTSLDDMYLALTVLTHKKGNYQENVQVTSNENNNIIDNDVDLTHPNYNLDLYIFNKAVVDAVKSVHKDPFERIFEKGSHHGSIINLELCPSKTLITTLGDDKMIKFWEFGIECREIFSYYFHDNPQCIALHPMSFQLAVGFKEGVRFYYYLEEDLKLVYTYNVNLKSCLAMQYSEGGNVLAAGNGQLVNIYDTYTFKLKHTLSGHSGIVKDIQWLHSDKILLTSCLIGTVVCWNRLKEDERQVDHTFKASKYLAITYDHELDILIGCCADMKTRLFNDEGSNMVFEYESSPVQYTAVLISKKLQVVFFGTSVGSIRVYLWPFPEFVKDNLEYVEFPIHQGPVTGIKLCADFSNLVTTSEDGSIYILKVKEYVDGTDVSTYDVLSTLAAPGSKRKDISNRINAYLLNSFCVVGKSHIELKKDLIKELEFKIQNAKSDVEDEKEKLVNYYNQRIKSLEEKNRDETLKHKEALANTMEDVDNQQKQVMAQIEETKTKHESEMIRMEESHHNNLMKLYKRNDDLKKQIEIMEKYCEEDLKRFEEDYKSNLKDIEMEMKIKYHNLCDTYNKVMANLKMDEKKFKEALHQSEEDFDIEFDITKEKLDAELKTFKKKSEDLKGSITKHNKDIEKFKEKRTALESLIKEVKSQNEQLEKDKINFQNKIALMHKQLSEREEIINQKEQLIKEYRTKNVHLQNFRSVFDHRVTSLKEEHTPLEDHLENMEKHIKAIYKELLDEANSNKSLREQIRIKNVKIEELEEETREKAKLMAAVRRTYELYEHDLLSMMSDRDFEKWEKPLKDTIKNYTEKGRQLDQRILNSSHNMSKTLLEAYKEKLEDNGQKSAIQAIKEELIRQRDFMNKKLLTITKANDGGEIEREKIFIRIQNENTHLINECNFLRKQKNFITNKIGMLEKQAKELARDLDDSFLDEFRTRDKDDKKIINMDQKTLKKSLTSSTPELPFIKRQQAKEKMFNEKNNADKLPYNRSSFTNNVLHTLLKEIDKFNEESIRQKFQDDLLKDKVSSRLKESSINNIKVDHVFPGIEKNSNNAQINNLQLDTNNNLLPLSTISPLENTERIDESESAQNQFQKYSHVSSANGGMLVETNSIKPQVLRSTPNLNGAKLLDPIKRKI